MTGNTSPPLAPLLEAMKAVMEEVKYIQKDGTVSYGKTNYKFVSAAGLISKIRPVMLEHGLLLMPSSGGSPPQQDVVKSINKYKEEVTTHYVLIEMTYTLSHISGAVWPHKIKIPASGCDTGDKATYKALTGAIKYALLNLFLLETGDDPENTEGAGGGNNTTHKKSSPQNTTRRATPPQSQQSPGDNAPQGIPSPHFTNIFTKIDTAANEGKLTEEWWKAESPKWRKEATPAQWNALVGKMKKMKAKVPDLPPKLLDTLEVAFGAEGEEALRTEAAKIIEADKSLKEAVEANVAEIIRRGKL